MLLLTSQSFPHYGLERFFQFAKDTGYDGVEIMIHSNYDTQNPEYLHTLSERYDMPIKAFSLTDKNPERYMEAFMKTTREFEGVTVNLESPELFSFGYKTWINNTLPRFAKKYNLTFNRTNSRSKPILGLFPNKIENSLFALKKAGTVALDVSALWANQEEPMRSIEFVKDSLGHMYLSNVYRNQLYSPLNRGVLPLESILTKMKKMGYKNDFTVKISPQHIHEDDEGLMKHVLTESREMYEKYFLQA